MTALEKKLVALVTIALLIGLLVGYALNYVIYQPQLQDLQNSLEELNTKVDEYAEYNATTLNDLRNEISRLNAIIEELNSTTLDSEDNETEVPLPYERLQFQSLTAIKDGSNFELNFNLTNTGTAVAVLEALFLNDIIHASVYELSSFIINGTNLPTTDLFSPIVLLPGNTASGVLTLAESDTYTSGTTVYVSFRTNTLKNYGESVTLP